MKYQKKQYCIVIDGRMVENSIRFSKTLCIKKFLESDWFFNEWKDAYEQGVRCVKINIVIESAGK